MPKSVFLQAYRLFRRRKFSHVIRLLESQIFRFRNSGEFYTLLGSAYLYTGDLGGAESYLERAEQLRGDDISALLGLAAIAYKRGQVEEALKIWLKVIDIEPGNRKALKALNALRKSSAWEGPAFRSESLSVQSLLPSLPPSPWVWLAPSLAVILLALLSFGYLYVLPGLTQRKQNRPGVAEIELSAGQPLISEKATATNQTTAKGDSGGGASFLLTEKQIEDTFGSVKSYLLQYRDNLAIREINRLLLSNASVYVKEKARLMKTFVTDPDFSTIRDPFDFVEVRNEPALYADTYVVWKGKAANVRTGETEIVFDLLVGYHDEKQLLGLVPVSFGFSVDIENGYAVEVLGKVVITGLRLGLQGISIHRLYAKS